ncbi:MAG: hypothetical protein B7Z02_11540 [Rhodobacterales bacterium 32-67-9]|nr:MAG: hypothetical protein B7Z02_11540 [Rhodobacterales bacterium 32-67-9]
MRRMFLPVLLIAASSGVEARECAELGLSNDYLSAMFCAELKAIAGGTVSRGVGDGGSAQDVLPLPEWPEVEILQDAFRADPRKTLDLIRRIKDAGGLASE